MKVRAITGFFFVVIMLGSFLLGHIIFSIFFLLLSLFCLWEFFGLLKQAGIHPVTDAGFVNALYIFGIFALIPFDGDARIYHQLLFLMPVMLTGIFIRELFKKNAAPFTNIAYTYFGLIFTVVPFTFFHALAFVNGTYSYHFPLGFLLMLWANDTGAYLVGSRFGRVKLFERHSPKKTWEGFIGGIIITAGAALAISEYYTELPYEHWLWMGLLISTFGTIGDLCESMFKRSINVKDSGGILPGHGGLLDRFDGLLMAAPVVYAYLYFITNV